MPLPNEPVTLTAAQVAELNQKLSTMRHDINNQLCTIVGAIEVIRLKPQSTERMMQTLVDQTPRITEALRKFSAEFDQSFGISRP
jgi:hypothetical protein